MNMDPIPMKNATIENINRSNISPSSFWSVVVSISENHLLVRLVNCLWGAAAAPESTLARATEFRYINYAKFVVNFSRLPRSIACH